MRYILIPTLIFAFATSAFATSAPAPLSKAQLAGYASTLTKRPSMNNALARDLLYPATDITVVNGTTGVVFAEIPGALRDAVNPETNDHLTHPTLVGQTHINLQDPYGNSFFDQYVCRLSVVTIFGFPGSYRVNVDTTYCNRP